MARTLSYRQQVAEFRSRLNDIIAGAGPRTGRIQIDTTGSRTRAVPHIGGEDQAYSQLVAYGQRRHNSVARVLALLEKTRAAEQLHLRPTRVRAETQGAVWQAYQGTTTHNACHTCPSHLQLDGQLPTLITGNQGLRRHMIVEFADCMLMPRSINEVDSLVDEMLGRQAFRNAAQIMLNERGAGWREGLNAFKREMRELLGDAADIIMQPSAAGFQGADEEAARRLEALSAYYEGLYLSNENHSEIENFQDQVDQEMGMP